MSKERTPKSKIKGQLRLIWLRSRERATALKKANYSCNRCHVKQSTAKGREQKVEVHHKNGIDNWEELTNMIMDKLLVDSEELEVLCPNCHYEETYKSSARPKITWTK